MTVHWSPWLGLRVAGLATGISVAIGLWLANILTKRKLPVEATALPALVKALAPAAIVLYWLGSASHLWPFTVVGLVVAGVASDGPPFLSAAHSALGALDPGYGQAARSLGASEWRVFWRIQLPLAFRPILFGVYSAFLGVCVELLFVWWLMERLFHD
jgi:molybdate transport system permease protein